MKTFKRFLFSLITPVMLTACWIDVTVVGSGSVTTESMAIDCDQEGGSCRFNFLTDESIVLKAEADDGWVFVRWDAVKEDGLPGHTCDQSSNRHCEIIIASQSAQEQGDIDEHETFFTANFSPAPIVIDFPLRGSVVNVNSIFAPQAIATDPWDGSDLSANIEFVSSIDGLLLQPQLLTAGEHRLTANVIDTLGHKHVKTV